MCPLYPSIRRTAHGAGGGGEQPPPPPRIFQIAIFVHKIGNIRAKPLDFRARNGKKKYSGKRLRPPPPPPNETRPVRLLCT